MKHLKPLNRKALEISGPKPDVFAFSPLPKDCSSGFWPGVEVHSSTSSTDMNVSTQGLCSPFVKDVDACTCYWPAHDPDVVVEETPGFHWNPPSADCANIYNDWQNLRFVYPKGGQGADAWDKSDSNDLNEIYLKDNWADNGTEPSVGNPWESPDIFVRYMDEPTSNFPNPNVDYHQGNPIASQKNFLYARVRNKGQHSIDHIYVKFYVWGLSTNPSGELVGHAMIRDMAPNTVKVVKSIKPWIPQNTGHACMRVIVDSTQDPVKLLNTGAGFSGYEEKTGPQFGNVSVPGDNNVAQRNMVAVLAVPKWGRIAIPFEIRPISAGGAFPPGPGPEWYTIEVQGPTLSRGTRVSLKLPRDLRETATDAVRSRSLDFRTGKILMRIRLRQEQVVEASLDINLPPEDRLGQEHRIVIRQYFKGELLGGITVSLWVVAPENTRFIGNMETGEVHLSFCPRVSRLEDGVKRAFFSLNDARSWGYKVHRECAVGHD